MDFATPAMKLRAAYREVFESDAGKRVLADLADQGCMVRSTFVAGDSNGTAFAEGGRNLVLHIYKKLDKDESYARELEQRRLKETRQEMDYE